MTDYDKACKILIDRCQKIIKSETELDSCFWQSIYGKLGVKTNKDLVFYVLAQTGKSIMDKYAVKYNANEDPINTILDYAKDHDMYLGSVFSIEKFLDKGTTKEQLLVEYDLKHQLLTSSETVK